MLQWFRKAEHKRIEQSTSVNPAWRDWLRLSAYERERTERPPTMLHHDPPIVEEYVQHSKKHLVSPSSVRGEARSVCGRLYVDNVDDLEYFEPPPKRQRDTCVLCWTFATEMQWM